MILGTYNVATLFPLRGQGLGRKLMEYIETLAPSYGIQNLVLGAQVQARDFMNHSALQRLERLSLKLEYNIYI